MDTKRRSKADETANTSTAVPEMQDKESQTPLEAAPEAVHSSRNAEHHVSGSISRLTTGVVDTVTDTANTMIHGVGSVGGHAIGTAAHLVTDVVSGARHILGTAFGSGFTRRPKQEEDLPLNEDAERRPK